MAVTRIKNSGIKTGVLKYDSALGGYPPVMAAPTATAGTANASIAFTAVTGATNYTVISTPGSFTGTGTTSPITVSGLSNGTAYTFQVRAENSVGNGAYSAASNSVTPVSKPTVTGGTLTSDATYYYRTFTGNGTLTVSGGTLTADVQILSGGGGAGTGVRSGSIGNRTYRVGGGGGSGALRTITGLSLNTSYSLTIGSGGTGAPDRLTAATAGSSSSGFGYSLTGGGQGGSYADTTTNAGNSTDGSGGGGAAYFDDAGGSGATAGGTGGGVYGFNGQAGLINGNNGGSGGGVGGAPTTNDAGAELTDYTSITVGAGGAGYGKTQPYTSGGAGTGASAPANRGGGGGGNYSTSTVAGGNGGSGKIVVRYTKSQVD